MTAMAARVEAVEGEMVPARSEVLARYRRLRAISRDIHNKLIERIPHDAVLRQARKIGLAKGRTFILDSFDDLHFAFDFAIYSADPGSSRAIDRYAETAQLAPESEEAEVLAAMRQTRFVVVVCEGRHPVAGVLASDRLRDETLWIMDEGWESSLRPGMMMATRIMPLDDFAMTTGIGFPFDVGLLRETLHEPGPFWRKDMCEMADDRRFAQAVCRVAVKNDVLRKITFEDVPAA
jgi:hypothetical protein